MNDDYVQFSRTLGAPNTRSGMRRGSLSRMFLGGVGVVFLPVTIRLNGGSEENEVEYGRRIGTKETAD